MRDACTYPDSVIILLTGSFASLLVISLHMAPNLTIGRFVEVPLFRPGEILCSSEPEPEVVEVSCTILRTSVSARRGPVPGPCRVPERRVVGQRMRGDGAFVRGETIEEVSVEREESLRRRGKKQLVSISRAKNELGRTTSLSPNPVQLDGLKKGVRCFTVSPRSPGRPLPPPPRRTSSKTVSASGSGTSEARCESYHARS